ncbi:LGFP repeat-containing protein [Actinoplanes flavus]|uniref:LGFP repeat-containing protein n=1 Tax=Actinoplanes flavus TaxID=2820290 RepID=A0ABS3UXI2_9ACTN|nr:hypothetical protein [Actinoplanes flavus]MBO3743261.1 hypothetical protein [Actinoplanes flavus]
MFKRLIFGVATMSASLAVSAMIGSAPARAGEGSYHCGVLVYGAIEDKYLSLNAQNGKLGCPTTTEADAAGGGRQQWFRGGSVFWHSRTGAHVVWGAILQKWGQYGREGGYGYPVTDEMTTPDGVGRYNHFERGGSIYWTPATGAHPVYGAIRSQWAAKGWERGCLRYPIADEADTPGGGGRYQLFQGGTMYWTSNGGAHATC